MEKWRNFFLKRMGEDANGNPYPICESVATWGVWCKDIPFKLYEKVKDPAKRSWNDEDGDDEYIPKEGLFMESYTMKVDLCCKSQDVYNQSQLVRSAEEQVRINVKSFLDYLRDSGMLIVFSTYTGIGRQMVRLESVGNEATWKQGDDGWWFLIFDVTLKVNDPGAVVTAVRNVSTGEITGFSIATRL